MDLNMSSLGTFAPEGPYYVFYVTKIGEESGTWQILWNTMKSKILIWSFDVSQQVKL